MKIEWDKMEDRKYENGVDHGVLYVMKDGAYPKGVAWNGLTAVNESSSGGEVTKVYADNIPYLSLRSVEEAGLTIECITYPDEFAECDGSKEICTGVSIGQQPRKSFGLCYRTNLGNAVSDNIGYKLHLAYGCSASPSEKSHGTINENQEAMTASYTVSTVPVAVTGYKPTSVLTIDSTQIDAETLLKLEDVLYGTADTEPRLPLPDEVMTICSVAG